MIPGSKRKALQRTLAQYPIDVAYLFGSQERGDTGPGSDVDIGVYFGRDLNSRDRFDHRLSLIGKISNCLQTDRIDLVSLSDAPLSLQFRAIREGGILYCRDELTRIRTEVRVMSLYYDEQYYSRRHASLMIERIAQEGIL